MILSEMLKRSEAEIERMDWRIVAEGMRKMRTELEKTGVRHSWTTPYIDIAESRGKEPK